MATMTMLSGSLVDITEKLDRSPPHLHDPEVISNATADRINEQSQTTTLIGKNEGNNENVSNCQSSFPNDHQVAHALSDLSFQGKNSMNDATPKKYFGNLGNSLLQHELESLKIETGPKLPVGESTTFTAKTTPSFSSGPSSPFSSNVMEGLPESRDNYTNQGKNAYSRENYYNNMGSTNSSPYYSFTSTPPSDFGSQQQHHHHGMMQSPNESLCSVGSSFTSAHGQPKGPVLYSAIGSFEHMNNSSSYFREITSKVIREQQAKQASRFLIPPLRPQDNFTNFAGRLNEGKKKDSSQIQSRVAPNATFNRFEPNSSEIANKKSNKHVSTLSQQLESSKESSDKKNQSPDEKLNSQHIVDETNNSKMKYLKVKAPMKSPTSCIPDDTIDTNNIDLNTVSKKSSITIRKDAKLTQPQDATLKKNRRKRNKQSKKSARISAAQPEVIFCPSSDAYTPRINPKKKPLSYLPAAQRTSQVIPKEMGTISRPNFRDALRRVAMILHQHILKIERRFEANTMDPTGLFLPEMRNEFKEDNFAKPRYKCTMVRVPMARAGVIYSLQKLKADYEIPDGSGPASVRIPTEVEIYEFAHQLFKKVQLSSECSIVCLIYIERLMEIAKVPLMACTWRPIFMAGLLLASKVWQDLSSWNIEFAIVYPQFSLESINRLEAQFLRMVKWDLYISSRYV